MEVGGSDVCLVPSVVSNVLSENVETLGVLVSSVGVSGVPVSVVIEVLAVVGSDGSEGLLVTSVVSEGLRELVVEYSVVGSDDIVDGSSDVSIVPDSVVESAPVTPLVKLVNISKVPL